MSPKQLTLIDDKPKPWRLSDQTREIGRRGIAQARAELARTKKEPA